MCLSFNQTCSARSVLSNVNDTSKHEQNMIDMEFDETGRESMGVEMKIMSNVDNSTIMLFLLFNETRTRSVLSNANETLEFEEILIDVDCNEAESEITGAEIKEVPAVDNNSALLLRNLQHVMKMQRLYRKISQLICRKKQDKVPD